MEMTDEVKEFLRKVVNEAVAEALTVDLTWEKVRDEKTGLPLAAKELINEKVFLPAFFCQHLKFHEGAYRGNQETLDKVKNNAAQMRERIDIMGQSFLTLQEPMVVLERFVGLLVKSGIMDRIEDVIPAGLIGPVSENSDGERPNAGDNR